MTTLRLDKDSLPEKVLTLLSLPLRHGGFGLRNMAATAPAAFLGSLAAAARHLPSTHLPATPLMEEIEHALSRCQFPGLKLAPAISFLASAARRPPRSLQHTITLAIEDHTARSAGDTVAMSSHLLSLRQAGASSWLVATPSRPELMLSNDDFRLAARLRLRLPPSSSTSDTHCSCGDELLPDHFMVCKYLRRRSVTSRHAALLQLLVSFLREAGLQPIPEARTEDGERPDLRLALDGVSLLLDVSVTHPAMPSALTTHLSSRPLGAAKRREYEKRHKYSALAVIEGATVIPLVLESTGALGEGLRQFIRRISSRVRDGEFAGPHRWWWSDFS
jgi:hypothetical protein